MKKNAGRLSKKVFAAMMAGTLMTAMVGANVSAATLGDNIANVNVTIKKQITKDSNVYLPDTTFEFSVAPGTAVSASDGQKEIKAGVLEGVSLTDNSITSSPSENDIGETAITLSDTATLDVEETAFTEPGVYRYVVTEQSENPYEGIVYSNESYFFDVYVEYVGEELTVTAYTFVTDTASTTKEGNVIFTNDYTKGNENGGTHDITLNKVVSGNQASHTQDFAFDVTVTDADETGEQYYVAFTKNGEESRESVTLSSGVKTTIYLKADETATIYGLSENDTYTIAEQNYSAQGYTTQYTGDNASGTMGRADHAITVTNTKNASTPTGITMTYGPYALMVALAGGMAVLFFRRRNREDY